MPYQREAEIVLAAWREAERKLAKAVSGTDEEEELVADLARFRDEYQRLIRAAREHHRPEPPPFPDES
jgi:isocitrate dehydrogenase